MKLTYYVNTMMLFESKASRVLCDPWVTFDRKSRSGLFNFPEVTATKEEIAAIKPDFIYITHTHADHFDPDTLALFDKSTPVLVSWYENNFTARAISALGFTDIRISDPEKGIALNGDDHCWIEPSKTYEAVDSIAVFKMDGTTLLNANDCPYHDEQVKSLCDRYGPFDVAGVPFGFQGPYPMFYQNLTIEEKKAEAEKKKIRNYDIVADYVRTLAPKYYFPITGGAVYGGQKALMMPYSGVGTASGAVAHLQEKGIDVEPLYLSEGCGFDFATGEKFGTYREMSHEQGWDYIKAISEIPGPFSEGGLFYIAPSEQIDLSRILPSARKKQMDWQQRLGLSDIDSVYFIDVGHEHLYRLCLGDDSVTKVKEADIADESYEIFRVPYSLMIGMLTRHYNYSNVKTQFIDFYRKPNVFNPDLHILMSHLHLP